MDKTDTVIAVFAHHNSAEAAVKRLTAAGFEMKNLSVVGKGYQIDEKVVGFYNGGDRIKFWGTRGAFWGGLWGMFFGGLFLTIPVVGHVIVLGYLASLAVYGIGNAIVVGGLSALGAALYGIGIPKDSVIQYETAVNADSFLVMAQARQRTWLAPRRSSVRSSLHALMCMRAQKRKRRWIITSLPAGERRKQNGLKRCRRFTMSEIHPMRRRIEGCAQRRASARRCGMTSTGWSGCGGFALTRERFRSISSSI